MNLFGSIILITLLADYLLDLISSAMNLKSLDPTLPEEFRDHYDAVKYARSQEYTKVSTKFGYIVSTFSLVVLLIFWFSGGFEWLDQILRSHINGPIARGLCYMGILAAAMSIMNLPFEIYSTFVIEERFGFNKTTPATFIMDIFKSLGLSLLIGAPVLGLILFILQAAGPFAWLYGWGATIIIGLFIQYLAPTLIMPMFNKFTPLEEGELKDRIFEYAGKVNYPLKQIFSMDGSKRSTKSNAFFTGFGKNKRIVLFDTLLARHTTGEIVAILAHEIGHFKLKHIIKGTITGAVHYGILFFLLSLFLNNMELFEAFYVKQPSIYAGLIFFGMLYSPVEMILSIVMNISSRKHEYEADRYSANTTGKPEELVNALKKLSVDNLSNLTPHPFYVFLNYSHPTVMQRIKALRVVNPAGIK